MREKGQNEVAKTLETPVFSRGIEILTEKEELCKKFVKKIKFKIKCRLRCVLLYGFREKAVL